MATCVAYANLAVKRGTPVQLMQTLDMSVGLWKGVNTIIRKCDRHLVVIRLQRGARHHNSRATFP